jgi:hypothetical protein
MNPRPAPRRRAFAAALLVAALAAACSHSPAPQPVLEPPRIDLSRFGTLGLVEFRSSTADGFGASVSREFLAALQAAQPGTPVLELGDERRVLAQVGASSFDPEAVRALAAKYRVDSLVVGALDAQRVSPKFAFDSGAWMTASAVLDGSLHVRILDARTGATLWSNLARAREEVARMNVSGSGVSGVGANPPDEARERMIERLINRSTDDFWAHWR